MHNVRRYFKEGDLCFLTHVTYERSPILLENLNLLRCAIERCRRRVKFRVLAWVVIYDHWHVILQSSDHSMSDIVKRIKLSFAGLLREKTGVPMGRVWHNRYWDHIIRDEEDLRRHLDYIHYNPVKHGLVSAPIDYPHSSFRWFVEKGMYVPDWGANETPNIDGEFGE